MNQLPTTNMDIDNEVIEVSANGLSNEWVTMRRTSFTIYYDIIIDMVMFLMDQ